MILLFITDRNKGHYGWSTDVLRFEETFGQHECSMSRDWRRVRRLLGRQCFAERNFVRRNRRSEPSLQIGKHQMPGHDRGYWWLFVRCPQCVYEGAVLTLTRQGAALIAASLSDLSQQAPAVADQIAGAILYGYTRNEQNGGRIPNYPTERTKVFCAVGDLVCEGTLIVLAPHLSYGDDVDEAVDFLAQRVEAAGA